MSHILIVDDDPNQLVILSDILKRKGFTPVSAQTGTAALAQSEGQYIDVALIDLRLEDMSGLEVLRGIKARSPKTECILLTGHASQDSAIQAIQLGAYGYFQKPFDIEQVLLSIQRALEKHTVEEALHESEARYRDLVENSPDLICTHDLQGNLLFVNEAGTKISGYSNETLLKMNLRDILTPEMRGRFDVYLAEIQAKGQAHGLMRVQTAAGEIRYLEFKNTLQAEALTAPIVRGTARDVTERKQAEEALRENETRLRHITDNMLDVIGLTDTQGVYKYVSPSVKTVLGYEPSVIIGKTIFANVHPDDLYRVMRVSMRALLAAQTSRMELRYYHADGHYVWLESTGTPVINDEGQIIGAVTSSRDITERKQAEEAVQNSEKRFRALIENGRDNISLLAADGTLLWESPSITSTLGYTPNQFVGRNIFELMHPDDQGWTRDLYTQVVQTPGRSQDGIFRLRHGDGTWRWIESTTTNLLNEPSVQAIVINYRDITERVQAEEALAASDAELRALFASMKDVVLVIDRDGVYRKIAPTNPALLVKPPQEMLGKNLRDVFPTEQAQDFINSIRQVLETRQTTQIEYELPIGERIIWFSTSISPMTEENTLWVARDITEYKQAEEALRQSEERFRHLFTTSPDAILLIEPHSSDTAWHIVDCNEATCRMNGYTREELIGQSIDILNIVSGISEERNAYLDRLRREGVVHVETFHHHKDGHIFPVETSTSLISLEKRELILDIDRDVTERKQAEEEIHQRVAELELLYQSGLALGQLLNPHDIAQKIIELLEQKKDWHHTTIRLYHPQDDTLELLAFKQPELDSEAEKSAVEERFKTLISKSGEGLSGWAVQNSQTVRSGDVSNDSRYVDTYPGLHSGLYVPMKLGQRMIGVISIESELLNAFDDTDERLISTLATQAASAFENARLFDETLHRVAELEVLNRVSVVLRTIAKQDQMLAIVLEETLKALKTEHGAIELWDKTTNSLQKSMARGWPTEVTEPPQDIREGIAGRVFTSGENYIAREFVNDPVTRAASRNQIPPGWGGICVPIRSAEHTLGTLLIAIPSERELNKDEIRLLNTLAEMTGASLHRMRLYEEAVHRMQDLQALQDVDQAITSNFDLRPTLDTVITHALAQLRVDAADILLLRPHLQLLEYAAGQGFRTPFAKGASVRMGDSLAGRAALERHTIHISSLENAHANADFASLWKSEGFASYYCVPLLAKGEVKGVLEVYKRNPLPPDPEWINYLETLAGQAAIAIDVTQLFDNLQRANLELGVAYETTIESWSRALSLRDAETEGHTQRVTEMVTTLAQSFNFSGEELQHIRRGAILHDIGKMGVPDHILRKPGSLTDEEWVIMRRHPQLAYDMLKPIAYLHNSLDIPYCHHEKWDGSGYPRGLAGDNIPLAARIFAIVDVYDAITSDRPYRLAWSNEKALEYIREQKGKHFDPQVVEIFLRKVAKR